MGTGWSSWKRRTSADSAGSETKVVTETIIATCAMEGKRSIASSHRSRSALQTCGPARRFRMSELMRKGASWVLTSVKARSNSSRTTDGSGHSAGAKR